jgi:hypothetical protein
MENTAFTTTDIPVTAEECRQFIHELFETFVDGPLLTAEQRKQRASDIALSVVETRSNGLHMAYNHIRNNRAAKGLPLGGF